MSWDLAHCDGISITPDGTTAGRELPGNGWAVLGCPPPGAIFHRTKLHNWGLGECALAMAPPTPAIDLKDWHMSISWQNSEENWAQQYYGIRRGTLLLEHDLVYGTLKATFWDDDNVQCGTMSLTGIPVGYRIVCSLRDNWNCRIMMAEYAVSE